MTKKDYVKFANRIRSQIQDAEDECNDYARQSAIRTANDAAGIFAADNPRFDRERFLKACGMEV